MVFREQEAQDLCAVCRDLASEHCLRCRTPFCERHKQALDERCTECESLFLPVAQKHATQMVRLRGWQRPILLTAASATIALSIFSALKGVWVTMVMAAFMGIQLLTMERAERREQGKRRRRFLAERASTRLSACYCNACWRQSQRSADEHLVTRQQ